MPSPALRPLATLAQSEPHTLHLLGFSLSEVQLTVLHHAVALALTVGLGVVLLRMLPLLERFLLRWAKHLENKDPLSSTFGQDERARTVAGVVLSVSRAAIWVTTILAALSNVGIAVGPVLAGAGIAGVALGFGAQSIIKDFFAGFFILLEGQFDVGNTVTIGTVTGVVEQMTLRLTVLRDAQGTAHFIPNSNITNVANKTHGYGRAVLDLLVHPTVTEERSTALFAEISARMHDVLAATKLVAEPLTVEGPNEVSVRGTEYRLVLRCHAAHLTEARHLLLATAAAVLRERGATVLEGAWLLPKSDG